MYLLMDIGNSAFKWRLVGPGQTRLGGGYHGRDWRRLADSLGGAALPRLERIVVASVAGGEADRELGAALADALGPQVEFCYSEAETLGVRNAYADPRRLGVDRWLAVVEAFHRSGPAIVVDCGSALTLDAVDAGGNHTGGYIVPGVGMLLAALDRGTADVHVDALHRDSLAPGRNTSECVRHGVLRMTVAFVTDAVVALRKGLSDTCVIILTGGDADLIRPHLQLQVRVEPDLVLDGLDRVVVRRETRG